MHAVADQLGLVARLDPEAERTSLDDLMAHKLKVILQRSERKDYQDIAAMIRAGGQVARGLAAARLFFGKAFQPAASLKALTYFRDGDLGRLSGADRSTLIKAAKSVRALPVIALRSKKAGAIMNLLMARVAVSAFVSSMENPWRFFLSPVLQRQGRAWSRRGA